MRFLLYRTILYLASIMILALATMGAANTAFASLSESGPASVSATAVTLNGTDQTTTYAMGLTVANTPGGGNGNGWNLTITSTTFTCTACSPNHSLSTTASSIQAAPTVSCNSGCSSNPNNNISYPLTVPAGTTAPTPVKFFNAAVGTGTNTGSGSFAITPTVTIAIPANTFAGSYTSTVTIAITSGP
jgi:hypothetical protein